jgi:hypothetical protein
VPVVIEQQPRKLEQALRRTETGFVPRMHRCFPIPRTALVRP